MLRNTEFAIVIIDAYDIANDQTINTDMCIIGGGIVGIAIAHELRSRGLSVTILESGGQDPERETQELYRGDGRIFETQSNARDLPGYLIQSRLRQFGGSMHAWGAKCGIPDAEVFESCKRLVEVDAIRFTSID